LKITKDVHLLYLFSHIVIYKYFNLHIIPNTHNGPIVMLDNISTKLTQDKYGKQKEEKLDKTNYWNLYRYNIV